MRKVLAIAALLGSAGVGVANAAPVPATMVTVGSFSKNCTSAALWAVTANNTATWTFDTATSTLAMASGTYERRVKAGAAVLMTHTMTGTAFGPGAATGATWLCTEGAFGGVVGAHICGNYNLGADFTNNSTYNQSTPDAISATVTLAGDDFSLGAVQTLVNSYSTMTAAAVAGAAPGFQRYTLNNGQDLFPGAGDTATGFDTGYIFTFDIATGPLDAVPVISDGYITTFEDNASGAFAPTITLGDGTAAQHTLAVTTQGANGSCVVTPGDATGTVVYTPNASYTGTDSCVLTLTDSDSDSDTATISVTVNTVAANDDGPITAGQSVVTVIPVGANDQGFIDPVTITVTTPPLHGTIAAISPAGPAASRTISYVANAGYTGPDSFVYTMSDGSRTDTAAVNLTVTDSSPVPATMVTVGSFSKNSTSAALWAVTANDTATWTFDTATSTLAMASGTYERRVKAGAAVLMTHTMTGTAFGPGAATGATWLCTEGAFGGVVGAHICGNYNLGADFTNNSTYNQSTPDAISATVTLAGDDFSLGAVQTLVNSYSTMTAAAVAGAAPGFQRYTLTNGQDLFPVQVTRRPALIPGISSPLMYPSRHRPLTQSTMALLPFSVLMRR